MRRVIVATMFILILGLLADSARAVRLKEIVRVKGVRTNYLHGVGLVVGLAGTGDGDDISGRLALNTVLESLDVTSLSQLKLKSKNVALVSVTAEYPAFGQAGDQVDVKVASVSGAKSLRGGRLLDTVLYGPAGNGKPYALARGSLVLGAKTNHATAAEVPNGAILEATVPTNFVGPNGRTVTVILDAHDFTTASNVAGAINAEQQIFGLDSGQQIASALSAAEIQIDIPETFIGNEVGFISRILQVDVEVDTRGMVVIHERTNLVAVGEDVTILPVAITLEGVRIEITSPDPQQPATIGSTFALDTQPGKERGTPLKQLVDALNQLQIRSDQLIAIIQVLKEAGLLQGKVVVI